MRNYIRLVTFASCCLAASLGAQAETPSEPKTPDTKKTNAKDDVAAEKLDALFGDTLKSEKSDDLKALSSKVKSHERRDGLGLKEKPKDVASKLSIVDAFAAELIRVDKKKGCQPAGRKKVKVTRMDLWTLPTVGPKVSVCVTLKGGLGRPAKMAVAIVDARKKKIGSAETIIEFRGRPQIDNVMEFPALRYETTGPVMYRVEIDGKLIGDFELFKVYNDED